MSEEYSWLKPISDKSVIQRLKHNTYIKARIGWHGLNTDEHQDEGPFLVTGTDFLDGQVDWASCTHVSMSRWAQDSYIQLQEGDLLLTKDGTIGKLALVKNLLGEATLNSGVFVLRPQRERYLTKFLFYVLKSDLFTGFRDLVCGGSTINHLYQRQIGELPFPVWEKALQKRIADYLDRKTAAIDGLIAKKERLIELLEEKRAALINQAVTKGLDPNVPMFSVSSDFFTSCPTGWILSRVKFVVTDVADGPHFSPNYVSAEDGVMFLSARNIKPDRWSFDDAKYVSEEDYQEFCKRVRPCRGDVLYSKGGTTGIARAVDFDTKFQVWVHLAVLKLQTRKVTPEYLAYALNSAPCYAQSQLFTRGATNQDLGLTRMINIELLLPPLEIQNDIVVSLDIALARVDRVRHVCRVQIERLQEYRQALITEAVTGKIDVTKEIQ